MCALCERGHGSSRACYGPGVGSHGTPWGSHLDEEGVSPTTPMTMPTMLRSLRHLPRLPQARVTRASHCSRGGVTPYTKTRPAEANQWLATAEKAIQPTPLEAAAMPRTIGTGDDCFLARHRPPTTSGRPARKEHARRARMQRGRCENHQREGVCGDKKG